MVSFINDSCGDSKCILFSNNHLSLPVRYRWSKTRKSGEPLWKITPCVPKMTTLTLAILIPGPLLLNMSHRSSGVYDILSKRGPGINIVQCIFLPVLSNLHSLIMSVSVQTHQNLEFKDGRDCPKVLSFTHKHLQRHWLNHSIDRHICNLGFKKC